MTAITTIRPIVNDDPPEPCGDDCTYIGLACRCRHGETVPTEFDIPALNDIVLPF